MVVLTFSSRNNFTPTGLHPRRRGRWKESRKIAKQPSSSS
jgi:hypothetical protein